MGLIKAISGSMGGTLANQWKEFFYCEAMNKDVLVTKGVKKSSNRSSNSKGDDNIISRGSGIAVADGQCMIIVQQGKIVEMCAEPGEFTFDSSTEPSIFTGNLGDSVMETFGTMIKRFTYGGDTGKDQRIYYLNLKEIIDNTKKVFEHSLKYKGTYPNIDGKRGTFEEHLMVHKRQGKKCYNCGSIIIKEKVGGRGTYYCPKCQKKY